MSFITRKHLSRRTLLRGVGVSIGLPLLDSMVPAQTPLAKSAATSKSRLSCIYGVSRRNDIQIRKGISTSHRPPPDCKN